MCDFNGAIMQIHIKAVLYLHTYIWFNYIFFSFANCFCFFSLINHIITFGNYKFKFRCLFGKLFIFFKKRKKKIRKTKSECSGDIHLIHQQEKNNKLNKLIDEFYLKFGMVHKRCVDRKIKYKIVCRCNCYPSSPEEI